MQCPYCQSDTKVTNSRPSKSHPEVWRRRTCKQCSSIWTTREYIDLSTSHRARTRHKRLQAFSRDILFLSIKDSLNHRKTATADATALTDTVLGRILSQKQAVIETTTIIEISQEVLYHFDRTASAVYRAKQLD
jgi:transcriptional regulator NrdR family protein